MLGPLAMLVPEGARTIVVARPAEALEAPAVRRVVDAVAPPKLLDAFARRTGVEPGRVEQLAIGEYDDGFVVIARGPFAADDVARAAGMRMIDVEARSDAPFVRRLGYLGAEVRDVVALADDVIVVGHGPAHMSALLSRAKTGEWPESSGPALGGEDATALRRAHGEPPIQIYAPEPLELPPGFGTSVLLARERAMVATVGARDAEQLAVEVVMRGEFPPGAEDNFRALVESIAASKLGSALGLAETLDTLRIQVDEGRVALRMDLRAAALARGLRVLFVAEIEELLEAPPTSPEPGEPRGDGPAADSSNTPAARPE